MSGPSLRCKIPAPASAASMCARRKERSQLKMCRQFGLEAMLLEMIADSLAASIKMTECAVALYEAVCRGSGDGRQRTESYVPARLEPTIAQWTGLYE